MADTASGPSVSLDKLLSPGPRSRPPPTLVLPEGFDSKLTDIIQHFNNGGYTLPIKSDAEEKAPLSEREMIFLSKETIMRFLMAVKGDTTAAIARLEKTLIWRRTENVDDLEAMAVDCEPEARTGKNIVMGYDPHGRPIIYFFPNRNTTPPEKRRAVHAIFMLERASDLMMDGVTNTLVIFSFIGKRQGAPTSVAVARETLYILAEYYPEKLGASRFLGMPWVVKAFVNLMWPFVDGNTKKKVKFDVDVVKDGDVESASLLTECGGDLDLPYDHATYWPAMMQACRDRRADQLEKWRSLGRPEVGREERLFKSSTPTRTITNANTETTNSERLV